MERATPEKPLSFIYGVGMMLPKFEEELFGMAAGDAFDFVINNEEAYGPYVDENVIDLDRAIFEIDGKLDTEMVFEGNVVPLMDNEGNRINAQVVSVTDAHVKVDLNHPLAGENLHLKVKCSKYAKLPTKNLQLCKVAVVVVAVAVVVAAVAVAMAAVATIAKVAAVAAADVANAVGVK